MHARSGMAYNHVGTSFVPPIILPVRRLMDLSEELYRYYLLARKHKILEDAVQCARAVLDLVSPVIPAISIIRYNLARPLLRRFQQTRQAKDLTKAIKLFRLASLLLPEDSPLLLKCSRYLYVAYVERDCALEGLVELNGPRTNRQVGPPYEQLMIKLGEDDEVFDNFWQYVANGVQAGFSLDLQIHICQEALEFFFLDSDRVGGILTHLGTLLTMRFSSEGKVEDINEGVNCFRLAFKLLSPTSAYFGHCVCNASTACSFRYTALAKQEDHDDSVRFAKHAVKICVPQNPYFVQCLESLAIALMRQGCMTGDMNDLDAAIECFSRAVDIAESKGDFSHLPDLLKRLSTGLQSRFFTNGRAKDITEAIVAIRRAIALLAPKDPRLPLYLDLLSGYEGTEGCLLSNAEVRAQALLHQQLARSLAEENGDFSEVYLLDLFDLRISLSVFPDDVSLTIEELDRAIAAARHFMSITPVHSPVAAAYCKMHCDVLYYRWLRIGEADVLNEAISVAYQAVELCKVAPECTPLSRRSLAWFLYCRYKSTGVNRDLAEALAILLEGFRMSGGTPFFRLGAGAMVMDVLYELGRWADACKLFPEFVDQLGILNGRSLGWHEKQHVMRHASGRASTYVSAALEEGSDVINVINVLETCRGCILSHLIDNRADLDDLAEVAPEKAQLFETLRNKISTGIEPSRNMGARVGRTTRMIQTDSEIRACLEDIRKLEGFDQFLMGPTQEDFKLAAEKGPVIIVNVTRIRSDAVIITKDTPVLLPLPELKYQTVEEYIRADLTNFTLADVGKKNTKYRKLQKWLWEVCVKLIFEKLDGIENSPAKLHVWWMPIGIAGSLPFHAAGIYTGNNRETALSRAVSSYTSTLKVLIHGRRKLNERNSKPRLERLTAESDLPKIKPRLAVIIMPSTPGMCDLEGVKREAEEVQRIFGETHSTQILLRPSAKDAIAHMESCEIVHFACHGEESLTDPSSSYLALLIANSDSAMPTVDKLTLKDVAAADVRHGKLAFLSACFTAQNRNPNLWDEVLHLASGFQLAGYLHTVGNLWQSDDDVSVKLIKSFYENLVAEGEFGDGHNIAKALNEAVADIAKENALQPLCWVQFVHFGV